MARAKKPKKTPGKPCTKQQTPAWKWEACMLLLEKRANPEERDIEGVPWQGRKVLMGPYGAQGI